MPADVVAVELEGGAEQGDVLLEDRAAERIEDEADRAVAAAEVDRVDFAEDRDGFTVAEFFGADGEGADVFGEAAAARCRHRGSGGRCARRVRSRRPIAQLSAFDRWSRFSIGLHPHRRGSGRGFGELQMIDGAPSPEAELPSAFFNTVPMTSTDVRICAACEHPALVPPRRPSTLRTVLRMRPRAAECPVLIEDYSAAGPLPCGCQDASHGS